MQVTALAPVLEVLKDDTPALHDLLSTAAAQRLFTAGSTTLLAAQSNDSLVQLLDMLLVYPEDLGSTCYSQFAEAVL